MDSSTKLRRFLATELLSRNSSVTRKEKMVSYSICSTLVVPAYLPAGRHGNVKKTNYLQLSETQTHFSQVDLTKTRLYYCTVLLTCQWKRRHDVLLSDDRLYVKERKQKMHVEDSAYTIEVRGHMKKISRQLL